VCRTIARRTSQPPSGVSRSHVFEVRFVVRRPQREAAERARTAPVAARPVVFDVPGRRRIVRFGRRTAVAAFFTVDVDVTAAAAPATASASDNGRRQVAGRLPAVQEHGEKVLVHRTARPPGHVDRVVRFVLLGRQQRRERARPVRIAGLPRLGHRQGEKRQLVGQLLVDRLRPVQDIHTAQVHGDVGRHRYDHTLFAEIRVQSRWPSQNINDHRVRQHSFLHSIHNVVVILCYRKACRYFNKNLL